MDLSFDLLGAVQVPGMRAEVRQFASLPTYERTWEAPSHILSYRMTPASALWTRRVSRHPTAYAPLGPLAYRPRSATWECKSNGCATRTVMSIFDDETLLSARWADAEPVTIEELSMMELMRLLHDEVRCPGFASTAMVESIAELLRIKLVRLAQGREQADEPRKLDRSRVGLIRDYVAAQKGRSPSVAELAALCKVSRRSLLRRFKAATGQTVADYIAQLQLERAKALLASSTMELKQIAWETGFSTPSTFSVAFKRGAGMTPSAFRSLATGI
jgi:AraC family transcriptional regulator